MYVVVAVFIVLTMTALTVFYSYCVGDLLERENKVYLEQISGATSHAVENNIRRYYDVLSSYALLFSSYCVKENVYHADSNFDMESEQNNELKNMLAIANTQEAFDDVAMMDRFGNALTANTNWTDLSYRNYFKKAMNGEKNISTAINNHYINGQQINVFAVPMYYDGVLVGVMTGKVFNSELGKDLQTDIFDGNAFCCLMSTDGTLALAIDDNTLGISSGKNFFDTEGLAEGDSALIKNAVAEKDAEGVLDLRINDERYFVGYNTIENGEWIVLTIVGAEETQKLTGTVFLVTTACVVGFLLVLSILVVHIIVTQFRSKREIKKHMLEFEQLAYVGPITKAGTWNKLAGSFPSMMKDFSVNYAVVSVDIDKFRAVNDLLGHNEGNIILRQFADIISRNMKEHDSFGRMNSDLFYCIVSYKEESDIIAFINNVITDVDYQITQMRLILSFGIYKIGNRNVAFRVMCDRADLARRDAKSHTESTYAVFDASMLSKIREEKMIEDSMELALESGEFKVYLQPKYSLGEKPEIIGAEALCRWQNDDAIILPSAFIPLFEKNRFVIKLDYYIFEEVCRQQKMWINKGLPLKIISVNMSRIHLQDPSFSKHLSDICRRYNVSAKYFEIEITESAAFENLEVIMKVFSELKSYGFHISIDDFGTGYSSLNMLKDLSVDVLKIDRAFLLGAEENERACEVIAHVISLAVALKMQTICEGVETQEQAVLLKNLGCNMVQGFLYAKPMPIQEYEKLLYERETKYERGK